MLYKTLFTIVSLCLCLNTVFAFTGPVATAPGTRPSCSVPVLDLNNMKVISASCGENNGFITGIQVLYTTGNVYYRWEDSEGKLVSNSLDLVNTKGGTYRFKCKDESVYDTVFTSLITIDDDGRIQIDSSNKKVNISPCFLATSSIQGIIITGADSYVWKEITSNQIVSTTADVVNVGPGSYQLTVSNKEGCSYVLPPVQIPNLGFQSVWIYNWVHGDAYCDLQNGELIPLRFDHNPDGYSNFIWTDSASHKVVGYGRSLYNLAEGTYLLSVTDANGCSGIVFSDKIIQYKVPEFDSSQLVSIADTCDASKGSILQMKVIGLFSDISYRRPVYEWTNSSSELVGNDPNLLFAKAGIYTLKVTMAAGCPIISKPIIINDVTVQRTAPVYRDTLVARNSPAYLSVQNFVPGEYLLFDGSSSSVPVDKNTSGTFTILNVAGTTVYSILYQTGSCSTGTEVKITAVDLPKLDGPNAFSPNGDGINDIFRISVNGYFVMKELSVFDRSGQKIFSTNTLIDYWDGKYKGQYVPIGVYYFILQGSDIYNRPVVLNGSITLLK